MRRLSIPVCLVLFSSGFTGAGALALASPASASNSAAAKACHQGGSQDLVSSDGTAFTNVGDCVSYAAQGGTLVPASAGQYCASLGGTYTAAGTDLTGAFPSPQYQVVWTCDGVTLTDAQTEALTGTCLSDGGTSFAADTGYSTCALPTCHVTDTAAATVYPDLAGALAAAAAGDTVEVEGDCVGTTTVTQDVTIQGVASSYGAPTLDGGGAGPVLTLADTAAATVDGLTVTGGNAVDGGGIYAEGTLTLTDVTVTANTASGNGGGICMSGTSGQLKATDVTVEGNTAAYGGGIYAADLDGVYSGTFSGGTIDDNTATSDGGGVYLQHTYGGTELAIDAATLSGNVAGRNGGGMYVDGGGALTNSAVSDNSAGQYGGGVYDLADPDAMGVKTDTFTGDSAGTAGDDYFNAGAPI